MSKTYNDFIDKNRQDLIAAIETILPGISELKLKIIIHNLDEIIPILVAMESELIAAFKQENDQNSQEVFKDILDKQGGFVGYEDAKVAKRFFKKLGMTPRFNRTKYGKIQHWLIGFFLHDPFDNNSAHYIGKKVKDMMAWHSAINIFGNLIAALLSVDLGKNVVDAFIRQAGAAKGGNATASIAASLGIYGGLTYFNEGSVRYPTYYEEKQMIKQNPLNIRPKRALAVKAFMIGIAALSGALYLSNSSKSALISRETQDVITKIERKANKADQTKRSDIERIVELGKLRKKVDLNAQEKDRESKLMKSLSENPAVPQAQQEASYIIENKDISDIQDETIKKGEQRLRELEGQKGYYRNKLANPLTEQEKQQSQLRIDETDKLIKDQKQAIQDIKESPYPLTPERKAVVTAKKDLAEVEDPEAFLEKYLVKVHGQEVGKAKMISIKKDIEDRPLAEKVQIVWDENREAFQDGRIPSLVANAILPIAIEMITAATMLSLITSIRYRKLYTNEDFQNKYGTLVVAAQQYVSLQTKWYLMKKAMSAELDMTIELGCSHEARMYSSQIIKEAIAQGFREESFPAAVAVANWYLRDLEKKAAINRAKFWSYLFKNINIMKYIRHMGKGDKIQVKNENESEREIHDTEQNSKSTVKKRK